MTLFTTDGCPKCEYAKQILDNADIQYEISDDKKEASMLGIKFVPSLLKDDGTIIGYPSILKEYWS